MNPIINTTTVCRSCAGAGLILPDYQLLVDAIEQESFNQVQSIVNSVEPPDDNQKHLIAHKLLDLYLTYIHTNRGIEFLQLAKEFDPNM